MNYKANDLAIELTKKIQSDIIVLCAQLNDVPEDTIKSAPNFYQIRDCIFKTLSEYIVSLSFSTVVDKRALKHLGKKEFENFQNHQLKAAAHHLLTEIIDNEDIVEKYSYNQDDDFRETINRELTVVLSCKLNKQKLGASDG